MKHFSPLWSLIPGAALIAGCGSQPKDKTSEHSPQKPNVVYLIADDLGIGDLSCYGATKVSTPNIDRLAGQGMQFTNAYATSSTSTPSRFGLLTGMSSAVTPLLGGLIALILVALAFGDSKLVFGRYTSQTVQLDRAIADPAELKAALEQRLGASVASVRVVKLDLVNDLTLVDVRSKVA